MADKVPSGRGAGRGRSKSNRTSSPPPKQPTEETVVKLDLLSSGTEPLSPQSTSGQFADATEKDYPNAPSATVDNNAPPPSELKESLKAVKAVTVSQDLVPTKPLSASLSNGPSEVTDEPQSHITPVVSKQMPTSISSSSTLNVHAPEFVPGSVSPARSDQPLTSNQFEAQLSDNVLSLVVGFEHVGKVENLDSDPLILAAANMLIDGTQCFLSYEAIRSVVLTAGVDRTPTKDTLNNVAEMLIYWGVAVEYFRSTACRIWEVACDLHLDPSFRNCALSRLMEWYKKEKENSEKEEFDVISFLNFSLFFSELFSRLRLNKQPYEIFSDPVLYFVKKLIALKTDDTVIGACNILKLTRSSLAEMKKTEEEVSEIIKALKSLVSCPSLSKSCIELIARVIELEAREWRERESVGLAQLSPAPLQLQPVPSGKEEKGKLNADAPAFVPSNPYRIQQPVTDVAEWNEFETDYNDSANVSPSDDYDGMDPEIELEMEAFISEIEEHLLNQEYYPEDV